MSHYDQFKMREARRSFLRRGACCVGSLALAQLFDPKLFGGVASADPATLPAAGGAVAGQASTRWPGIVHPLQFAPKAKRVIHLYMAGGPSHLETLDPKPQLAAMDGKPMPDSFTKGQPIAQLQGKALTCYAPQFAFQKFGKCGTEISSIFPQIGSIADDICVIRSLQGEAINHDPAHTFMNTGTTISGRPSMGSWAWYGLGAAAEDLPGFVVLTSTGNSGQMQPIAQRQWSSGFIPSRFQGILFNSKGDAVQFIRNPNGVSRQQQRDVIDAVNTLNQAEDKIIDDPEIATRLAQYELAFKMQASVPSLMDMSGEPKSVLDLYGTNGADGTFAANCLTARRLAERGVRFIQVYHRDWDHHSRLKGDMQVIANEVDRASAALITDLKQRGMLDDTLVIWGGEFGRTPMAQGDGRDHHIKGFSCWMAGGGIKGGIVHGATDDFGYNAVQDVVTIHDLHATILRLMGVDHTKLTYRFQGRDFRLTDVSGEVVQKILA